MKPSTLNAIRKGLRKVVEAGTGYSLNGPGIPPAAGKTGTAEDSTGGPDHAWFGCYAPYPDGKIVVVAFAQNTPGGFRSCVADGEGSSCRLGTIAEAGLSQGLGQVFLRFVLASGSSAQLSLAENVLVIALQLFRGSSPAPALSF